MSHQNGALESDAERSTSLDLDNSNISKQLTAAELAGELLANLENDIAFPQRETDLDAPR